MKTILLTFDYEIFFGAKSGTPDKCILNPTYKILNVFKKSGIKGTFFVDVLYYLKLTQRTETQADAMKIKEQLQEIILQGSRIELHLHPHWLDAVYSDGEWKFPSYQKYRLQALPDSEIHKLFSIGVKTLQDIANEVMPNYRIMAYRAGGFCIQPFDKLRTPFLENNIIFESSVAPGLIELEGPRAYDFRKASNLAIYPISKDPLSPDERKDFYEVPISTYRIKMVSRFFKKIKRVFRVEGAKFSGNGIGIGGKRTFLQMLLPQYGMISLDGHTNSNELLTLIKEYPKDLINVISHPKSMTNSSFDSLELLAAQQQKFITFKDLL